MLPPATLPAVFASDTRCVIACSGGADSVALVARLAEGWHGDGLHVASVDHGLRGDAGARDVALVGALAARFGLPFHSLRIDVGSPDAPGSLEARARAARYAALGALAERLGASVLAVGHTLDDLAETVWLRLVRGAGPRGLAAMPAARPLAPGSPVTLWRPLLAERRAALRAGLRARGIPWSEDATNAERRFARNRVRLDALPALARVLGADPVPLLARLGPPGPGPPRPRGPPPAAPTAAAPAAPPWPAPPRKPAATPACSPAATWPAPCAWWPAAQPPPRFRAVTNCAGGAGCCACAPPQGRRSTNDPRRRAADRYLYGFGSVSCSANRKPSPVARKSTSSVSFVSMNGNACASG